MGHYYAEMMCSTCGKINCVCPRTTRSYATGWHITADFKILPTEEYKNTVSHYDFVFSVVHTSRESAAAELERIIEDSIQHHLDKAASFKKMKKEKPWLK